jgi:hypothetical protein
MRKNRFSRLNRRAWLAAAVSAAFLVPLGILGGPALASSVAAASQYEYGGSAQYQYKVTLCHHTHSRKHPFVQISVSVHAVKAHLRHGDTIGACPTTAPAPTTHHGDSGDHGKGNGQGKNKGDDQSQNGNSQNGDSQGSNGGGHGNGHGHH